MNEIAWVQAGGVMALILLSAALALTVYRLVKGPTLADRVLSLDLLAVIAILVGACLTVLTGNRVLLDASLVIALLAFISSVAFARYMERLP